MISIENEISKHLNESISAKQHHLFKDEKTTFRQLKQALSDALGDGIVKISRNVPMVDLYLTQKDGDWLVSSCISPAKCIPVCKSSQLHEVEQTKQVNAVQASLDDVVSACEEMDDVFLNKCFANGKNKAHIALVCPAGDGSTCFLVFKGIDCFNDKGKCIGFDNDLGVKFLYSINGSDALKKELEQIPIDKIRCMKRCMDEKKALQQALAALDKMVDGLGWGCSLKYYIDDKYSRYVVNKALEHGLDISKNGQLANELVSRLSGAGLRPTKSDLVTFAKREGIDCKSDEYKQFLDDVESTASQMSSEIISPIEKVICYAIQCAANNIIAMMQLDSSQKAQKMLSSIALDLFDVKKSIDDCSFDISDLHDLKKALVKLCQYQQIAPPELRFMHNHMPYSMSCDCSKLQKLCDLI